jgi:hypothetical protein
LALTSVDQLERTHVISGTAVVMYADTNPIDVLRAAPVLDRSATVALVERLFPGEAVTEVGDALLADAINPAEGVVYVGCFPGLDIVCGWQLVRERPSESTERIVAGPTRRMAYLHAMHTGVDWCTFAIWTDGALVRGLSVSAGSGIVEDLGDRLTFEEPYWAGEREDCPDDEGAHPLAYHPVALGREALHALFGFRIEGHEEIDDVDPEIVPLVGYRMAQIPAVPA